MSYVRYWFVEFIFIFFRVNPHAFFSFRLRQCFDNTIFILYLLLFVINFILDNLLVWNQLYFSKLWSGTEVRGHSTTRESSTTYTNLRRASLISTTATIRLSKQWRWVQTHFVSSHFVIFLYFVILMINRVGRTSIDSKHVYVRKIPMLESYRKLFWFAPATCVSVRKILINFNYYDDIINVERTGCHSTC